MFDTKLYYILYTFLYYNINIALYYQFINS